MWRRATSPAIFSCRLIMWNPFNRAAKQNSVSTQSQPQANRVEELANRLVREHRVEELEGELQKELHQAMTLTREKQSTIIRLALRCGLPLVLNRFQAPAPEGTFAEDYQKPDRRIHGPAAKAKTGK